MTSFLVNQNINNNNTNNASTSPSTNSQMQTPSNQLYQRHDFQNRRSASEPVHDLQQQHSRCAVDAGGGQHSSIASGTTNAIATGANTNQMQIVGGDDGFVDCLQKITTIKVRFNPRINLTYLLLCNAFIFQKKKTFPHVTIHINMHIHYTYTKITHRKISAEFSIDLTKLQTSSSNCKQFVTVRNETENSAKNSLCAFLYSVHLQTFDHKFNSPSAALLHFV